MAQVLIGVAIPCLMLLLSCLARSQRLAKLYAGACPTCFDANTVVVGYWHGGMNGDPLEVMGPCPTCTDAQEPTAPPTGGIIGLGLHSMYTKCQPPQRHNRD